MKKGFSNKLFVFLASFSLLFNSLSTPLYVYAQDITPTPEPTPIESPTPEPTVEPTVAPTEEPSPTPLETIVPEITPTPIATVVATPTPTPEETVVPTFAPESNPTTTAPPEVKSEQVEVTSIPTVTSGQPQENGHISAVVLSDTNAVSIPVNDLAISTDGSATLQTDKADYAPTDSVLVTGSGFTAGKTYTIIISSSDDPAVTHEGEVTADSGGKIIYSYQLDGNFRPNYKVEVKDGETVVASTTFTDGNVTDINIGTQVGILTYGTAGRASFTISFTKPGNDLRTISGLSVTSGLPTGASASWSATSSSGTNSIPSVTLTITTLATTPAGSFEFTVSSTSPPLHNTGTLVVLGSVTKTTPTITFGTAPTPTYLGGNFTVSATTTNTDSSVLTYSWVSGPCTFVSGSTFSSSGAGTCVVQASGAATTNFNAALNTQNVIISKANQTITFGTLASKTYGDADFSVSATASSGLAVTFSSLTTGICTVTNTNIHIVAQGTCTIRASQTGNNNYNAAPNIDQSFNIAKKPASVTPDAKSKVYGSSDPALTGTLTGFLPADSVTAIYSRISGDTVFGSPYTISAVLSPSGVLGNYDVTYNTASFTITRASQTITVNTHAPASAVYGSSFPVAATASSGLTVAITTSGGCSVSLVGVVTMTSGVTDCTVRYNQAGDTNYNEALEVTGTVTTSKAIPVITWTNPADIVYGTLLGGIQLNATASVGGTFIYTPATGTKLNVGNNQDLSVSFTPTDATNYNDAVAGVHINVNKATLTVTADNKSKTYGDSDPAFTFSYSGFAGGDTSGDIDTLPTCSVSDAHTNFGSYSIVCSGGVDNNYTFSYVSGILSVNKHSITVTADAQSKTYGDGDPTLTYTFTPALVTGDSFTGALTRDAGNNIGDYAITQGTLSLSSNYTLTYTGADLTIGERAIEITADAKSKGYGDDDPDLTYKITGGSLAFTDDFTGALVRDAGEEVDTYDITKGTLTLGDNYDLTFIKGIMTIIDDIFPTGNWVIPALDSTVSGVVPLEFFAEDIGSGVRDVKFEYKRNIEGAGWQGIDIVSESPYMTDWNTLGLDLDSYTLKATVTDESDNETVDERIVHVATVVSGESGVGTGYDTATVTWTTDRPTSSRVVYDTVSHGSLDFDDVNYGYAWSTGTGDTEPNKVLSHSVTIGGLSAGTIYYYRTVSEGSPTAIGDDHAFATLSVAGAPAPGSWSGQVAGISTVANIPLTTATDNPVVSELTDTSVGATEEAKATEENKEVLGTETEVKETNKTWIWIITIALLGLIGFIYLRRRNRKV